MTSVWLATACIGGFALGFGLRGFLHRNRALKGSVEDIHRGKAATAGGFAQLHTARANSAMLEPLARVK